MFMCRKLHKVKRIYSRTHTNDLANNLLYRMQVQLVDQETNQFVNPTQQKIDEARKVADHFPSYQLKIR